MSVAMEVIKVGEHFGVVYVPAGCWSIEGNPNGWGQRYTRPFVVALTRKGQQLLSDAKSKGDQLEAQVKGDDGRWGRWRRKRSGQGALSIAFRPSNRLSQMRLHASRLNQAVN